MQAPRPVGCCPRSGLASAATSPQTTPGDGGVCHEAPAHPCPYGTTTTSMRHDNKIQYLKATTHSHVRTHRRTLTPSPVVSVQCCSLSVCSAPSAPSGANPGPLSCWQPLTSSTSRRVMRVRASRAPSRSRSQLRRLRCCRAVSVARPWIGWLRSLATLRHPCSDSSVRCCSAAMMGMV